MSFINNKVVIIIGNGFDLAPGLETSYEAFSEYLISEILVPDIFREHEKSNFSPKYFKNKKVKLAILNRQGYWSELHYSILDESVEEQREMVATYLINNPKILSNSLENEFVGDLYENTHLDYSWFDIERAYFIHLSELFHDETKIKARNRIDRSREEIKKND
tara:strand:+ start:3479 stop:3967 length:489 start_codon:yes stop_codon:yes gene_type:complete